MMSRMVAGGLLLLTAFTARAAPAEGKLEGKPAWVARSDVNARVLLEFVARFDPESAAELGMTDQETRVLDLAPGLVERQRAALAEARTTLEQRLAAERDPNIRQDLGILLGTVEEWREDSLLQERHLLHWVDAPQVMFLGLSALLEEDVTPERRAHALTRLRRYVGLEPDSTPLTQLAHARFEEGLGQPGRLGPVKTALERAMREAPTYVTGIRELFSRQGLTEAGPALDALERQVEEDARWRRETVLPRAREDVRLPSELYAFKLRQAGIDLPPEQLIRRAQVAFLELRAQLAALAPLVAKARGFPATDTLGVLRALKKESLGRERLLTHYRQVQGALEKAIQKHRVVELPSRPLKMRLASEAESAAHPAPYMQLPDFVGEHDKPGQFVLSLGSAKGGGAEGPGDDFTFGAAAWSLSAHEGRPGHELQFSAMRERGVSLARALFAFNSVNVEGWALYAEAEMLPHEPLDGQFIALQFRLLRAARAMLDPLVNLGRLSPEEASRLLTTEVGLSPRMVRQELDRYTSRAPGQAGSYFYGYTRLLELRAETELALGTKFDRQAFNTFLVQQGLLPPDLLAQAVREVFIPRYQGP